MPNHAVNLAAIFCNLKCAKENQQLIKAAAIINYFSTTCMIGNKDVAAGEWGCNTPQATE